MENLNAGQKIFVFIVCILFDFVAEILLITLAVFIGLSFVQGNVVTPTTANILLMGGLFAIFLRTIITPWKNDLSK